MPNELHLMVVKGRGVKFINSHLEAWFNLIPEPDNDGKDWYAGSATSVVLDGKEILDPFKAELRWLYMFHDHEKRCMQIDRIQLRDSVSGQILPEEIYLFDRPYELISEDRTPDHIQVTIASAPFEYNYRSSVAETRRLRCRLYRVITLYADADYLLEELSIKGTPDGAIMGTADVIPEFAARYYTHINTGLEQPQLSSAVHWLAAGSRWDPCPWYGFAAAVPVKLVTSGYYSFFSELAPCKSAKCLHLFMRRPGAGADAAPLVESRMSDYWEKYLSARPAAHAAKA